jgi:hypothetical protein
LVIFIFVDIFLLYDLKCKTKWYEKMIKNRWWHEGKNNIRY